MEEEEGEEEGEEEIITSGNWWWWWRWRRSLFRIVHALGAILRGGRGGVYYQRAGKWRGKHNSYELASRMDSRVHDPA